MEISKEVSNRIDLQDYLTPARESGFRMLKKERLLWLKTNLLPNYPKIVLRSASIVDAKRRINALYDAPFAARLQTKFEV